MSTSIDLSIITPVFNTPAPHLEGLSQSLAPALGDLAYEWLLVDDRSDSADTRAVLRRLQGLPAVRLIDNQGRKGAGGARNQGAAEARASRLLFVDSDDLLVAHGVERLFRAMQGQPHIRWLAGRYEQFSDQEGPDLQAAPPVRDSELVIEHWPDAAARLIFETLFNQGSYIIDRDLFLDAGGFDERFPIGEDWLLWMRLALRRELYHCDELVFWQRRGHESLMSGGLNTTAAIVAPYLAARRDPRFAPLKKRLRWRIYRLYRLLAVRNREIGHTASAVRFAALAALWSANEPQQWLNIVRAARGRPLR